MNYQSTFTLSIASGQETPWDFNMTMLPHPVYFAYWEGDKAYEPVFDTTGSGMMWNTQLVETPVPTDAQLVLAWLALAQRWRLCYESVTILQDGPDLANQGTIVVSQAPLQPRIFSGATSNETEVWPSIRFAWFDKNAQGPNFNRSQTMPNAMIGKSKEGAYVPLKLTDTCQDWQSAEDLLCPMLPNGDFTATSRCNVRLPADGYYCYPFWNTEPAHYDTGLHGNVVPALMNGGVAHICARNLSKETSFTFQFRMGIEVQLAPSSVLTPQLKLSPPYDPTALDTYFAISRELKDGYPADYNDWGKMWDVVSSGIKAAAPILKVLPGSAFTSPLINTGVGIGDAIRKRRNKNKPPIEPTAAQKEFIQKVRSAADIMSSPQGRATVESLVGVAKKTPGLLAGRTSRRSKKGR